MKPYRQLAENELLALVKQGDQAAFEVAYSRFRPLVYRYALRICRSAGAAEEIVQNVMLKMWTGRANLDPEQNFKGWLARVSANEAFDFLKKVSREKALSEQLWLSMREEPGFAENQYVLKDYLNLVEKAVQTLPPQQQKVYRLSREQYLTYEQIAEQLGISPNTVRNHMAAALEHIRKYLMRDTLHALIPPVIAACVLLGRS